MAVKGELDHHPLQTIEGMLKGSLKRLGDFFKDPQNFGSMTHDVLKGTGQRYQEALDKCEIQILNAKWMLEYELEQIRAKRAPKPVEAVNVVKRKHDEIDTTTVPTGNTKKAKNEDAEADHLFTLDGILKDMETENTDAQGAAKSSAPDASSAATETANPSTDSAATTDTKKEQNSSPAEEKIEATSEQEPNSVVPEPPQEPKSVTDQNMDFDSMLEGLGDNNDINFDDLDNLDATNSFDMALSDSQNFGNNEDGGDTSLNSLLPGLESYAKSTEDPANASGNPTSTATDGGNMPATSNAFDLPEMGENAFDDFFGDAMGNGTGESKDDDLLNDDFMMGEPGTFDDNWLMDS